MTFTMDVRTVILVLCAAAASARHLVDVNTYLVQPFNPSSGSIETRHNAEIVSERRSIDARVETNLNQQDPNVEALYRFNPDPNNHNMPERHPLRSHKLQREISENIDGNNNIGNVPTEYKLRTNANTRGKGDRHSLTTEHSGVNVYTNIKPEAHNGNNRGSVHLAQNNSPRDPSAQSPDITEYYRHGDAQDERSMVAQKSNGTIAVNHDSNIKTNVEPSDANQTNLTPNKGTPFVNNNKKKPDNVRRIVRPGTSRPGGNSVKNNRRNETRPLALDSKANGQNDSIPNQKDDDEVIGWVWGTEAGDNELTTEDDLGNRAAFSGDQCPTGKVKVEGLCVEKH